MILLLPFDLDSVNFLRIKKKYFKISSSDITNFPLIEKIAKTSNYFIIGSSIKEIKAAIKLMNKYNKKITILHCILNYPTKSMKAKCIDDLKKF